MRFAGTSENTHTNFVDLSTWLSPSDCPLLGYHGGLQHRSTLQYLARDYLVEVVSYSERYQRVFGLVSGKLACSWPPSLAMTKSYATGATPLWWQLKSLHASLEPKAIVKPTSYSDTESLQIRQQWLCCEHWLLCTLSGLGAAGKHLMYGLCPARQQGSGCLLLGVVSDVLLLQPDSSHARCLLGTASATHCLGTTL